MLQSRLCPHYVRKKGRKKTRGNAAKGVTKGGAGGGVEGRRGDCVPDGRKRGKRDRDTPKVRAVQLTPPY